MLFKRAQRVRFAGLIALSTLLIHKIEHSFTCSGPVGAHDEAGLSAHDQADGVRSLKRFPDIFSMSAILNSDFPLVSLSLKQGAQDRH